MAAVSFRWWVGPVMACAALGATPAAAQETAWRCVSRGTVTYSQVPCPGGRPVGPGAPRATDKWKAPPQDRAVLARRAALPAAEREECTALDTRVRQEERQLKARDAVTLQDELPLVQAKKRFRELKC